MCTLFIHILMAFSPPPPSPSSHVRESVRGLAIKYHTLYIRRMKTKKKAKRKVQARKGKFWKYKKIHTYDTHKGEISPQKRSEEKKKANSVSGERRKKTLFKEAKENDKRYVDLSLYARRRHHGGSINSELVFFLPRQDPNEHPPHDRKIIALREDLIAMKSAKKSAQPAITGQNALK